MVKFVLFVLFCFVHVCVYLYVSKFVCVWHVSLCVFVCVCVFVVFFVCMCACLSLRVCVFLRACARACMCM